VPLVTARTKRRESYFVDSSIIQETKLKRRREEDRCRRQRSMYTDATETRLHYDRFVGGWECANARLGEIQSQ
jgi:hypothetical protein